MGLPIVARRHPARVKRGLAGRSAGIQGGGFKTPALDVPRIKDGLAT
jgi:hypothetical protein